MTDIATDAEMQRIKESAGRAEKGGGGWKLFHHSQDNDFSDAANPAAVLRLIARIEMLQHENATCAAANKVQRDKTRIERERADKAEAELAVLRVEWEKHNG